MARPKKQWLRPQPKMRIEGVNQAGASQPLCYDSPKLWCIIWVLACCWGSFALAEEDPPSLSATAYFIEQYYLEPNPDFSAFQSFPHQALYIVNETGYYGGWRLSKEAESELLARHPDLAGKLEEGGAFRKKIYDAIFAQIPQRLKDKGLPESYWQEILKSYLQALDAYRNEEQKRKQLEAETLAYDQIRKQRGYPPGSSVSSWAIEDQRKHFGLVERLKDEDVRNQKFDDALPPDRFETWRRRMKEVHAQQSPKDSALIRILYDLRVQNYVLPAGYGLGWQEHAEIQHLTSGIALGSAKADKAGQQAFVRELHDRAAKDVAEREKLKVQYVGTGTYNNPERDPKENRPFRWLRDLEWWQEKEIASGNTAVAEHRKAVQRKIEARYREFDRDSQSMEESGLNSVNRRPSRRAAGPGAVSAGEGVQRVA